MLRGRGKVVPLRVGNIVEEAVDAKDARGALQVGSPKLFPVVTTVPRLPPMIPDEILDYYGWVFCQGGFLNLHMTFEQFLAVVAAVNPSALCPEYDVNGTAAAVD